VSADQDTPGAAPAAAPAQGNHTPETDAELLSYAADALDALAAQQQDANPGVAHALTLGAARVRALACEFPERMQQAGRYRFLRMMLLRTTAHVGIGQYVTSATLEFREAPTKELIDRTVDQSAAEIARRVDLANGNSRPGLIVPPGSGRIH
jgi:hypothetical protein